MAVDVQVRRGMWLRAVAPVALLGQVTFPQLAGLGTAVMQMAWLSLSAALVQTLSGVAVAKPTSPRQLVTPPEMLQPEKALVAVVGPRVADPLWPVEMDPLDIYS